MSKLADRLETVYQRIHQAAERAGRPAGDVTLVAVTKTYPLDTVIAAYQSGLRHFGENRTAEGREKAAGLTDWLAQHPGQDQPIWHLIGHVQSRQVSDALGVYRLIHSVDSLKLAERLSRLAERDNYPPVEVLLQVNVSGEASKSGFALERWATNRTQLADFLETVAQMGGLNKIIIRGLMTMAPVASHPENARSTFQSLASLREKLQTELPQFDWRHLSMGMSDDFEVAIEEGATIIRVGRAIFGERG